MNWQYEDIVTKVGIVRMTGTSYKVMAFTPLDTLNTWDHISFRFHGCWIIENENISTTDTWMLGPGSFDNTSNKTLSNRQASDVMDYIQEIIIDYIKDEDAKSLLKSNIMDVKINTEINKSNLIKIEDADKDPYAMMSYIQSIVNNN